MARPDAAGRESGAGQPARAGAETDHGLALSGGATESSGDGGDYHERGGEYSRPEQCRDAARSARDERAGIPEPAARRGDERDVHAAGDQYEFDHADSDNGDWPAHALPRQKSGRDHRWPRQRLRTLSPSGRASCSKEAAGRAGNSRKQRRRFRRRTGRSRARRR